jgi:hypothetical protein
MKTALALSAALAPSAARVAAQGEVRWMEMASDSTEVISIDTASVTPLGDSVYRVWERSVSLGRTHPQVVDRADFDCRLRLTRVVTVALPGFAPMPASDDEREWTEIPPGSSYEAEWRQVCSGGGPPCGPH